VLKPGCPSFHCLDSVVKPNRRLWVNGLVPYFYDHAPVLTRRPNLLKLVADPEVYYMSEATFDKSWRRTVGKTYAEFGRPFSLNLLWIR
jgi:hypothetical protein